MRDNANSRTWLLRALALISLTLCCAFSPAQAEIQDRTSAKSIAKPILMLMLYCHAALDALQADYEKDLATSDLSEAKKNAIKQAFQINKQELGDVEPDSGFTPLFHKCVKDKAISEGEAHFLDKTARKDAVLWYPLAKEKCNRQILSPLNEEEDNCVKYLNTEMHKCLISFKERVELLSKGQK